MILLSVRKQAGAKFLAPPLWGLLDLWREAAGTERGAENSHTSKTYTVQKPEHSSHMCPGRMLLRQKVLPTKRRRQQHQLKKKAFVSFSNRLSPVLQLEGVGEKRLRVEHDLRAKGRTSHRILTVTSKLDLGRFVKLSRKSWSYGVCLNCCKRERNEY